MRSIAKQLFWAFLIKTGNKAQAWFMPGLPDNIMRHLEKYGSDFDPQYFSSPVQSLFDILKKEKIGYRWRECHSYKAEGFHPEKAHSKHFVEVISITNLDGIGHVFGPNSSMICKEMEKLDTFIEGIIKNYSSIEDFHIMLFSDHGMAQVRNRVDIKGQIESLPIRFEVDYLDFYDSTFARFWVNNDRARDLIIRELKKMPQGRILCEEDLKKENLFFEDNRFGDIIFHINTGVEIFPNYFFGFLPSWVRRGRGMHGYDPDDKSQHGLFICNGRLSKNFRRLGVITIVDIMPTILEILELPVPDQCKGFSLLNNRNN